MNKILSQALKEAVSEYSPVIKEVTKKDQFEVEVEVPIDLLPGAVDLKVYAHYPVEVASIPFNIR